MNVQVQQVADRAVDTLALGGVGGGITVGLTIGQLNQYLQAGAFIVAMISGLCAAWYYIRKGFQK